MATPVSRGIAVLAIRVRTAGHPVCTARSRHPAFVSHPLPRLSGTRSAMGYGIYANGDEMPAYTSVYLFMTPHSSLCPHDSGLCVDAAIDS